MLVEVGDRDFEKEVEQASGWVAVDFWAAWCAPCRIFTPIVESVADEYDDRIRVLSLDTEASPGTAARYGIRGLPTMLFFRDGELVDRAIGALTRPALKARFEALLAED